MDVNRVYITIQYCANKNQQGYISPEDFYTIINTAQEQYFDYLLGEYQKYQPTRPFANVAFAETQKLRTSLAPLIYGSLLFPNLTTGIAGFPSDFELVDSMLGVYNFYNIKFFQQDTFSSRYRSTIDPIDNDNAVYLMNSSGFQFYPKNIGLANLSYVRKPPSIVWGYVLDSNNQPVYNPATSQQPVWGDMDVMQIIARALLMVGVNLQLPQIMQYSNEIKMQGQ
jgi:hypothetical protein